MEEIKIYVVGGATHYASWIANHRLVDNLEEADIVLFTGGEDVDPSIYGRTKCRRTMSNLKRDQYELEIFNKIKPNQLALGICRGSQFLCAVNGGLIIQDVSNHALFETHPIINGEGSIMEITSTHHQMQYPFNMDPNDYELLYWADPHRSSHYDGDGIEHVPVEPEIVYYKVKGKPRSLAIQGHPEMMRTTSPTIQVLNELVTKCLTESR